MIQKNLQKWSWKIQNLCVHKRKNIEKEQIESK